MAARGRFLIPFGSSRFTPAAYLLATRLGSQPQALARYLGDRFVPLALTAAVHHRSVGILLWTALLWFAYLGVYELFQAWNDRRGMPFDRQSREPMAILSPAPTAIRLAALWAAVLAWRSTHEGLSIEPDLFVAGCVTVALVFAVHNSLHETGRVAVKTTSFAILAALQFMPVAALLLPPALLLPVWLAHLCTDAFPRTVDYCLRKRRRLAAPRRIEAYRINRMVGWVLGAAAASSVAWIKDPSGSRLQLSVMIFLLAAPAWRAAVALHARLAARQPS